MNRFSFFQKHKILSVILAVIVIAAGWYGYKKLFTTTATTPTYQTAQAEKGTIVVSVTGSGTVTTANSGSVSTNATGVVKTVFVKNGQTVKAGAKIAEIDLDQVGKQKYQAALSSYQSAKNNVSSAQANLYSLQSKMFVANQNFVKGAGSTNDPITTDPTYIEQSADWLAAEASYKTQQNVIAQAQTAVNSAWMSVQQTSPFIYAPISGTITGLSLQPGSVIANSSSSNASSSDTSSQKVASIVTTAAPTLTVNLTEIDIPKVHIGDKATLTFDALTDKTYTGKVVSIDIVGSVSSNVTSYPAVIQLDNQVSEIFSNMSAQANIIIDSKPDVLLVPAGAVQTANGQSTVRVMKNNQPQIVIVQTGLSSDSQVEIISGLVEGDTVVTGTANTGSTGATQNTSVFSTFGRNAGGGNRGNVVRIGG